MNRKNQSSRIALCGILGALAVVVMLMGGVIPFATFVAPAIAGLLIVPIAIEYGLKPGALLYAAISMLALFMAPDKEMALVFVFFLGYYPLAKAKLDQIKSKVVQWSTKFALFNISILTMYSIIVFVFPIAYIVAELEESGLPFLGLLLLMGNATFVIYDIALSRMIGLYLIKFRARFFKLH